MINGLRTTIYATPDIQKGREWYASILGQDPYFDEPFYVGFDVGGYELGLQPERTPSKDGAAVYWGVNDIYEVWEQLIKMGAKPDEEIMNVGGEIFVASVVDPFGNLFGIIQNPNFRVQ